MYAGKRIKTKENTVGLGVSKSIVHKKHFDIGLGTYVTKPLNNLLDLKTYKNVSDLNFAIGLTGTWKF